MACMLCGLNVATAGCLAGLTSSPLPVPAHTASITPDLRSLMMQMQTPLPQLHALAVNGLQLEVTERPISLARARQLVAMVRARSAQDPSWHESRTRATRQVLSRWSGPHHEVLSLRDDVAGTDCIANYSRRDVRKPARRKPTLPFAAPAGARLLTVAEERLPDRAMYVFSLGHPGPIDAVRQHVVQALRSDAWRLAPTVGSSAEARLVGKQEGVFFAERAGDELRVAIIPLPVGVRIVVQVSHAL